MNYQLQRWTNFSTLIDRFLHDGDDYWSIHHALPKHPIVDDSALALVRPFGLLFWFYLMHQQPAVESDQTISSTACA
jgi:hypothetical protein